MVSVVQRSPLEDATSPTGGDLIRVLMVEDCTVDALLIREALRAPSAADLQVTLVYRCAEAKRLLATAPVFDAVLLDLNLPDSKGLATFEAIHQAVPGIPVVILTGTDDASTAIEAVRRGAQDFLVKGDVASRWVVRALRFAVERQRLQAERRRLQRDFADVIGEQQRRMGRNLHDGLGQHLTGLAMLAAGLQWKLEGSQSPQARDAQQLVELINDAKQQLQRIVQGLQPVDVDASGLMAALEALVETTAACTNVDCTFRCDGGVMLADNDTATQLFHIAQEALTNALKHASAEHTVLSLAGGREDIVLEVRDDGAGITDCAANPGGMGMRIMHYRAELIGAALSVERNHPRGTVVRCRLREGDVHGHHGTSDR